MWPYLNGSRPLSLGFLLMGLGSDLNTICGLDKILIWVQTKPNIFSMFSVFLQGFLIFKSKNQTWLSCILSLISP